VQGLWSGSHVLAWHLEQTFRDDSAARAENKCLQRDVVEKKLPTFLSKLTDCPCTLAQARADTGRFHTDYSCDIKQGSVFTYHPGSVCCVRAVQASPMHGSGQKCCYDSTGALVLTGDSIGGSTPERAHEWGSPPYREPPWVPGYSHGLYDVTSFIYCCLWSDNCHIYLSHRPSTGCRNYKPSEQVLSSEIHISSRSMASATLSMEKEGTTLCLHPSIMVLFTTKGTLVKATQLLSVAMKEKASDVIEVRLAEGHLQVLRNQKLLSLTEQRWMDLHGVFVFTPSPHRVTAMFPSGAAVDVCVHEVTMAVTVLLPTEFTNQTRGLLGVMNSDPSDDLLTQHREVISSANATSEEIFTFGAGCSISKESSLFTYDSKYLLDTYGFPPSHNPAFVPAFSLPVIPDNPLVEDMLKICFGEGAQFCKYDTLTTRRLTVGNATLSAYKNHRALMEALEPVVTCGWLPTPRNGKKNGTHYTPRKTLTFCNEGYKLYGATQCTCLDDGTWTGEQSYCITDDNMGFVLAAVGSLSVLVTMGVMIARHSRKQDREREKPEDMVTQEQTF
uniref:sushi domain-containing protein 2 n=1 Tax=Monopterus albus TaxID=43700 RepID=UPI0009B4DD95